MKKIGERIILKSLMAKGQYSGKIISVNSISGLCTVKLDSQTEPVVSVLYYDKEPEIINSNLWQVCWPEENKKKGIIYE